MADTEEKKIGAELEDDEDVQVINFGDAKKKKKKKVAKKAKIEETKAQQGKFEPTTNSIDALLRI